MSALLEVSGVSVSFDGFKAINNLSFSINEAELRAVIGPNGAGKTTFMDIVTGSWMFCFTNAHQMTWTGLKPCLKKLAF